MRCRLLEIMFGAACLAAAPLVQAQLAPSADKPSPAASDNQYSAAAAKPADSERQAVWNSPEMLAARKWVEDRGRRSVRFTPSDARRYLSRLEQSSPEAMRDWLQQFHRFQERASQGLAIDRAARQMTVGQALARQAAVQQSYDNINQAQSDAAMAVRDRMQGQQQSAAESLSARRAQRDADLATMYGQRYYVWVDPRNVPLWVQYRASASLPGNLPPGDPLNFIRGEEGVDLGESAAAAPAGASPSGAAAPVDAAPGGP